VKGTSDLNKNKRQPWKILTACAVLFLLAALVFAFRTQILTGIGNYLVVNDKLHNADIIFVLQYPSILCR
jgi:hypothetical protein